MSATPAAPIPSAPIQFKDLFPSFDPSATEEVSKKSWAKLFNKAVEARVPAYVVAVAVFSKISDPKQLEYRAFDALMLAKNRDSVLASYALNHRLRATTVSHFAVDCRTKEVTPASFVPFMPPYPVLDLQTTLEQIALDGCDPDLEDRNRVGLMQGIVSTKLLDYGQRVDRKNKLKWIKNALWWAECSAHHLKDTDTADTADLVLILSQKVQTLEAKNQGIVKGKAEKKAE